MKLQLHGAMKLHYDLFHFKRYLLYVHTVFCRFFFVIRIAFFLTLMSFVLPFFCYSLSFLIV